MRGARDCDLCDPQLQWLQAQAGGRGHLLHPPPQPNVPEL